LLEEQNTSADSRRLAIEREGSVDSRGGIKESDPLRIADTKVDAVAAGGVVGGDEGEVEIDRVLGVVGTVEKAKQFRAAVAEVVVSVQLVPGKDAGRALGGGTEEEERRFRNANRVDDILIDHDAVFEAEWLPADGELVIEALGVVRQD
jgi:hypothetical protein